MPITTVTHCREPYLTAEIGKAVYAFSTYAGVSDDTVIESVHKEGLNWGHLVYERRSMDNGETWSDETLQTVMCPNMPEQTQVCAPRLILDPNRDILIRLFGIYEEEEDGPAFHIGSMNQRTRRTCFQFSRDQGETWTGAKQVIDARPEYDSLNWAPGLTYGKRGGVADGQHAFLDDGSFAIGFVISNPEAPPENKTPRAKEHYADVIYARAAWNDDDSDLEWTFGEKISVVYPLSSEGCCEAAVIHVGNNCLFNVMRCQGDEAQAIFTTRFCTYSEDAGMTWTPPTPLTYDDDSEVYTPASFFRFFEASKTGKVYVIANILDAPVHGQMPRYPLTVAEFDTEKRRVLRDTVTVIQDLPEGAPVERRYTNWGQREERGTGDLILTMPEQPKSVNFSDMTKDEDFTSDCIRFRIRF